MAALILSISIVGTGYFLAQSIDRGTGKLSELTAALGELPTAGAAAPSQRAARPVRPDPNKRYEISVAGAPFKGVKNAAVTIVEWSDFQ
jgi:hypothetical protein